VFDKFGSPLFFPDAGKKDSRLLKNTDPCLRRTASASLRSSFVIETYGHSTPHSSRFRAPCIRTFLTSLGKTTFFNNRLAVHNTNGLIVEGIWESISASFSPWTLKS